MPLTCTEPDDGLVAEPACEEEREKGCVCERQHTQANKLA